MTSSSSAKSSRISDGLGFFSGPPPSSASASRWLMTKRLATSGEQSPRAIWRKTRSGRALLRDFEKETSFVRKMTWATLAVVRPAAHSEILS